LSSFSWLDRLRKPETPQALPLRSISTCSTSTMTGSTITKPMMPASLSPTSSTDKVRYWLQGRACVIKNSFLEFVDESAEFEDESGCPLRSTRPVRSHSAPKKMFYTEVAPSHSHPKPSPKDCSTRPLMGNMHSLDAGYVSGSCSTGSESLHSAPLPYLAYMSMDFKDVYSDLDDSCSTDLASSDLDTCDSSVAYQNSYVGAGTWRTLMPSTSAPDSDAPTQFQDADVNGYGSMQSMASLDLHGAGQCRPCLYNASKNGCMNGSACRFCHLEHKKKNRPRPCKATRIQCKKLVGALKTVFAEDSKEFHDASNILSNQNTYMNSLLHSMKQSQPCIR